MGAETKYRSTWPKRAKKMASEGMNEKDIAMSLGVHPTTFSHIKKKQPALREALRVGKGKVDRYVESALLKRATGYDYEEETTEVKEYKNGDRVKTIKRVKKHQPADVRAIEIFLYNRLPDDWKRNRDESAAGSTPDESARKIREALKAMTSLESGTKKDEPKGKGTKNNGNTNTQRKETAIRETPASVTAELAEREQEDTLPKG